MQKKYIFLPIIAILGLLSCSPKLQNFYSGEVNFLYKGASQGSIGVSSTGYGKYQADAIMDAQKNAFKVLLFNGIPDTDMNIPLIENENDFRLKHAKYFKKFFDNDYYRTFMMSSTKSSKLSKVKGSQGAKSITLEIKINYNSLRRDLEQNGIIRTFGF